MPPTISPTTSPTQNPTDGQDDYIRFQNREELSCLSYHTGNKKLIAKECNDNEVEQFWLYNENGFLINKTGRYVNKSLRAIEGTPNSINDAFVYNKFHETLVLAAKAPVALYPLETGLIKPTNYLKYPVFGNAHKWIILE